MESDLIFAGFAVTNPEIVELCSECFLLHIFPLISRFSNGFLCLFSTQVFNCPIRSDSAAVLLELEQSSHDLVYPPILKVTSCAAVSTNHLHAS